MNHFYDGSRALPWKEERLCLQIVEGLMRGEKHQIVSATEKTGSNMAKRVAFLHNYALGTTTE